MPNVRPGLFQTKKQRHRSSNLNFGSTREKAALGRVDDRRCSQPLCLVDPQTFQETSPQMVKFSEQSVTEKLRENFAKRKGIARNCQVQPGHMKLNQVRRKNLFAAMRVQRKEHILKIFDPQNLFQLGIQVMCKGISLGSTAFKSTPAAINAPASSSADKA